MSKTKQIVKTGVVPATAIEILADHAKTFFEGKGDYSAIEKTSLDLALLNLEALASHRVEVETLKKLKPRMIANDKAHLLKQKKVYEDTISIQQKNLQLATDRFEVSDEEGRFPHSGLISAINKITNDINKMEIEITKIDNQLYFLSQSKNFETLNIKGSTNISSNNALQMVKLIEASFSGLGKNGLTPLSKSKIESSKKIEINIFGDVDDED
jgi:hypothetical protein